MLTWIISAVGLQPECDAGAQQLEAKRTCRESDPKQALRLVMTAAVAAADGPGCGLGELRPVHRESDPDQVLHQNNKPSG